MKSVFKYISLALTAVAAVLSPADAVAQITDGNDDDATVLVLHLANGEVDTYALPDKPEVTFADGKVNVSSESVSSSYNFTEVAYFDFDVASNYDNSGIAHLASDGKGGLTFSYVDNATAVIAADGLSVVNLYDVKGMHLSTVAAVDGVATVSLSGLAAGTYVVVPEGHHAVKVLKK